MDRIVELLVTAVFAVALAVSFLFVPSANTWIPTGGGEEPTPIPTISPVTGNLVCETPKRCYCGDDMVIPCMHLDTNFTCDGVVYFCQICNGTRRWQNNGC